MQTIALYNRAGKRLLTLQEAEKKGHGSADTLRQHINRGGLKAYKVSNLWLVLEASLPRPTRRRRTPGRKKRN